MGREGREGGRGCSSPTHITTVAIAGLGRLAAAPGLVGGAGRGVDAQRCLTWVRGRTWAGARRLTLIHLHDPGWEYCFRLHEFV